MNSASVMQSLSAFSARWIESVYVASLQALIVSIVIGAIIYLLRNRISSQLKYALLLVVLVKFAMPPFWISSGPVGLMAQPQVAQFASSEYVLQAVELTPVEEPESSPASLAGSATAKPSTTANELAHHQQQAVASANDQQSAT